MFLKVKDKFCKKVEFFKQNKGNKNGFTLPKAWHLHFRGFGEGWGGYDCLELELEN